MAGKRPFVLIICDGWGENPDEFGNGIRQAGTPQLDALRAQWPHTTVAASGEAVGLPEGQIGNSEVGHLTIGTGRVTFQPLGRQHRDIRTGEFDQNEVLIGAIETAKQRGTAFHIMGLVSHGGVHSHQNGALALAKLAHKLGQSRVYVHAFTDGRDVLPTSAKDILAGFEDELTTAHPHAKIASVAGRYYAMDRDKRWDRVQLAYDMLTRDEHPTHHSVTDYVQNSYDKGETDEFLKPISIAATADDRIRLQDGDVVVFFNFRPDRARQLTHALVDADFQDFARQRVIKDLHLVSFAEYDETLSVPVAFPKPNLDHSLAQVISEQGLSQFHVAETEKYAHVTYFLNGGREEAFEKEDRLMVPSLKVATYDLAPAMSAAEVAEAVVSDLEAGKHDFIAVNFANADMVGHTGHMEAIKVAITATDDAIGQVIEATLAAGGAALMTADHGNAEYKIDPETKQPLTAHTTSPVPVVLCGTEAKTLREDGGLSDIAPTVLEIMQLPVPAAMTGHSLIK
ncbi:MAG TPA: 2,3-bisphosphoglycerate-independent phosphoglycerate mutase [Candidatus Saccharimonadia bacterium]|nr:2,3-bisphosphoglycerate-independent phosphoglycerate mutase [Candidatus Saccharimonadia bacterium]